MYRYRSAHPREHRGVDALVHEKIDALVHRAVDQLSTGTQRVRSTSTVTDHIHNTVPNFGQTGKSVSFYLARHKSHKDKKLDLAHLVKH